MFLAFRELIPPLPDLIHVWKCLKRCSRSPKPEALNPNP